MTLPELPGRWLSLDTIEMVCGTLYIVNGKWRGLMPRGDTPVTWLELRLSSREVWRRG